MTKRRIILVSVVFSSLTVLAAQTLPQTRSSNRTTRAADAERRRRMTDAERKREAAKRHRQWKLENEQRRKERMRSERSPQRDKEYKEQRRIEREQKFKENQERRAEWRKTFFREKCALRPTEEQWKLIKPKLEKIRHLREQARTTVGLMLTSSSSSGAKSRDSRSRSVPTWKWKISWKDKAPAELTEVQKIANELMDLVDSKSTKAEEFKKKMDALRKSRIKQREFKRQLSKARQELLEVLTPRQEAALELMRWF